MSKKKKRRSGAKKKPAAQPPLPLWKLIVQQLLLTGLVLCVFALFHHVLPRYARRAPDPPAAAERVQQTPAPLPSLQPEVAAEAVGSPEPGPFSAEAVVTDSSYSGPTLAFTISSFEHPAEHPSLSYYVADVHIKSVEQLRAALPSEDRLFSDPLAIVKEAKAILAVNGDNAIGSVFSVRNGVLKKNAPNVPGDICVLYRDGRMEIFEAKRYDPETILAEDPWQVWCFGPSLLDTEGQPLTEFNIDHSLQVRHPRTAIGYYAPGHYCLLVIDGRNKDHSRGATLEETAQILADLGCRSAYNLDGGASSVMIWKNKVINLPSHDRAVTDMIVLRELEEEAAP